ncbi:polymer-forming cytoskeletal [bacterium BMS3Abin07]|nr:polymer-forming cytoskeletal [bacterium BMS3Abin07]GBE32942.1 polymer-forming cytoskeletal [bacterium BMS3Bbin05]HDL20047.1 polymer-forming cytoskeletal protein [Nitrospirota bacterium]HDZ87750.1 polymer-forming cytoskeletal protein [Nitrospirota bacterium]
MNISKKTDKVETFIGNNSTFKGEINTSGTIRVDGTIEGNVISDWVVLGEKGNIKGDVVSNGIIVGGKIEGNIKAKEIIEVKNKGKIIGDILTPKLTIVEGGIIEGKTSMQAEDTKVVELQKAEK